MRRFTLFLLAALVSLPLVERAVSDWGGVDVLCNNVGIQPLWARRIHHTRLRNVRESFTANRQDR